MFIYVIFASCFVANRGLILFKVLCILKQLKDKTSIIAFAIELSCSLLTMFTNETYFCNQLACSYNYETPVIYQLLFSVKSPPRLHTQLGLFTQRMNMR